MTIAISSSSGASHTKLWIYASLAALFFLNGVLDQVYFWDRPLTPLDFLFGVAGGLLLFWWWRVDARQRGLPMRRKQGLAIVLFALFGFSWYLFWSRGFRRGLGATALFLLGLVASGLVSWLGALAAYYAFQA